MNQPTDFELLRRLEPILRFTDGELFFPMATSSYVEQCDLLAGPNLREARVVVPAGRPASTRNLEPARHAQMDEQRFA